jgi:hypothetical protein
MAKGGRGDRGGGSILAEPVPSFLAAGHEVFRQRGVVAGRPKLPLRQFDMRLLRLVAGQADRDEDTFARSGVAFRRASRLLVSGGEGGEAEMRLKRRVLPAERFSIA